MACLIAIAYSFTVAAGALEAITIASTAWNMAVIMRVRAGTVMFASDMALSELLHARSRHTV